MDDSFRGMLRTYRIAAGLTQEALATRALLSEQAVGALERGERRFPRRDTVARIADALGLDGDARVEFVAAAPSRGGPRPAEPVGRVPRELPADTFGFIGRADELATLDRLPGSVGVVAVCGTAGVGKTALAVHWAHRSAPEFPDGQLYVDLRGYGPDQPLTPTAALTGFLRSLGIASSEIPMAQAERASRYRTLLAERRMLVVLDNAHDFAQVQDLLPGSSNSLVVVTSRDVLAGLTVRHGAHRVSLDALTTTEAHDLLRVHIGPHVDAEPLATAALVAECARLPLALRIAAQLAATRPAASMATLVGELADEGDRLALLDTGDPHGSATAVFSWSYHHLPADAARLFRLLGAHPGRQVDAYAAAALLDVELRAARSLIATLARAHLLREVGDGRYDMHDLLRAYAGSLAGAAEADAALTRGYDYHVAASAAAMERFAPFDRHLRPAAPAGAAQVPRFADRAAALAWLDAERANLVALGAHGADHGRATHTGLLSRLLYRYLIIGAHYADAEHLYRAAVRVAAPQHRAEALTSHAIALWRLGRVDEALALYDLALAAVRATDDRMGEGRVLVNRGVTYRWLGRYDEAAEHHRRAIEIFVAAGDGWSEARARDNLGLVHYTVGGYADALEQQERALELYRAVGDPYGEAGVRSSLGVTCAQLGRHAEALDHHERALASHRAVGDRRGEAETLNDLGTTLLALGAPREASERHRQALARAEAVGDRYEHTRAREGMARCRESSGTTV